MNIPEGDKGYYPNQGVPVHDGQAQNASSYVPSETYVNQTLPPVVLVPHPTQLKLNQWQSELTDCCANPGGFGLCCYACWCTSCLYGQNVELQGKPDAICGGSCFGACLLHFVLGGMFSTAGAIFGIPVCPPFSWIVQMVTRNQIRTRYSLPQTPCHDCLVSCFCACCALAQENRELRRRKDAALVVTGVAVNPPPPQAMSQ
eukprot:jgi/Chlat1/6099/Chrsp40S05675